MGAKLLFRDPTGRDAALDVPPEGVYIGRGPDCAVRTEDAMVSRKNCKLSFAGGRWMVEDLGSSNGTFVNEARIQKQVLNHGDIIRCGSLQVRFVEQADAMGAGMGGHGRPTGPSVQVDPYLATAAAAGSGIGGGGFAQAAGLSANAMQEVQYLQSQLRNAQQELEAMHARREAESLELKK
jgi:hypothetical protein